MQPPQFKAFHVWLNYIEAVTKPNSIKAVRVMTREG